MAGVLEHAYSFNRPEMCLGKALAWQTRHGPRAGTALFLIHLGFAWERPWHGKPAMAVRKGTHPYPHPYMLFFLEGGSGGICYC